MMPLDMTAQFVPLYWATIGMLVASVASLVVGVVPRTSLRSRLSSRRRPRLFVPGNLAKASA